MPREYDRDRLERLSLYIASRSANDPKFGKTKLAKILFFSDFLAYVVIGDSITGAEYKRLTQGPVPVAMYSAIKRIVKAGTGSIAETGYFNRDQQRLVALKPVDLEGFSANEIALVDEIMEALRDADASAVSALSHTEAAWTCVPELETIPYHLAWVEPYPPSEEAIAVARAAVQRLGLGSG